MSDRRDLPEQPDDDLPFKLPREEDLNRPTPTEPSIEELHAQDPPLRDSSDNTITAQFEEIHSAPQQPISPDDDTDEIDIPSEDVIRREHKRRRNPFDDDDVPFRLPKEEDLTGGHSGELINKMVTMPRDRSSEPTLAGSGGYDPNPDVAQYQRPAEPTMQGAAVRGPMPPPPQQQYQQPYPQQQYMPPLPRQPQQAAPRPKKKPARRMGCWAIFLGVLVSFCGGMTLLTMVGGVIAYARIGDLMNEQLARFDDYDQFESSFVYDRTGVNLYEVFTEGRRVRVNFENFPDHLINATVAIEDGSFWSNIGIDIPATAVAFLNFIGADSGDTPGGSTITQQLVRNVLFDPAYRAERSATRKAEEIALAIALTGRESKQDILELYLNEIYYGNLAYGAQAASQIFFGKDVQDLTLGEAALLAGLPQAPSELDPYDPDPVIQQSVNNRWQRVLEEMVDEGFITAAQRDQALRDGYTLRPSNITLKAPHFTVYAQKQLEDLMTRIGYSPEEIARGGLKVYTTVDLELNDYVQQTIRDQISRLRASNNVGNGAVIVIKPVTGEILAMVGSADYDDESIDGRVNVTTSFRQPGSTMKIFTYAAALERGMTAGDVIWDTRVSIESPGQPPYIPRNYDGRFHGPMRIRTALANSYNIPAVQTLRFNVGVDYLLAFLERLGIESLGMDASRYGLSLTLGGGEVSLIELTNGFATFGNEGVLVEPQAIRCIINSDNEILYQYENGCTGGAAETSRTVNEYANRRRVLDERIAFIISDILSDNGARTSAMGANSPLYTPGINSAVKTGTTDDYKDNWTVGYTKNVAVGVWVGNTRGEPMVNTSGLTGAAPIWNSILTSIYNNQDWLAEFAQGGQLNNDQFFPPAGTSQRQICDLLTLQDPATGCARLVTEWFLDSPAGLPTADGGMDYPPAQPEQQPQIPATGSYLVEESPGVFRTYVHPIAPDIAAAIQFTVEPGRKAPPPPRYCRVPVELIPTTPTVREQVFIGPPPDIYDAAEAEEYARGANIAFLPSIDCSPELLGAGSGLSYQIQAFISSPSAGQVVPPEGMAITGTVQFAPGQIQFYRFLIRGSNFPEWTTIGSVHTNPVQDGQLEFLPGYPGLQPGDYQLSMEVIAPDSSLLQPPVIVPFRIEAP